MMGLWDTDLWEQTSRDGAVRVIDKWEQTSCDGAVGH